MAAQIVKHAIDRSGLAAQAIQHSIFGNVVHTDPSDTHLSRVVALNDGLLIETPLLTLNRLCGSGLQAIVTTAQIIMLGDVETAVAGGAENMSRAPYWSTLTRWD